MWIWKATVSDYNCGACQVSQVSILLMTRTIHYINSQLWLEITGGKLFSQEKTNLGVTFSQNLGYGWKSTFSQFFFLPYTHIHIYTDHAQYILYTGQHCTVYAVCLQIALELFTWLQPGRMKLTYPNVTCQTAQQTYSVFDTHSRKRVIYWRLQRDHLGREVPYRSCGDMTKGRFPMGSQSLPLPSCWIPKLWHKSTSHRVGTTRYKHKS